MRNAEQKSGSKAENFWRQAGLRDDGAGGADGQFLFRVRNDGAASVRVAGFGVAAFLGNESETMLLEHADDFSGTQPFRHPPAPGPR